MQERKKERQKGSLSRVSFAFRFLVALCLFNPSTTEQKKERKEESKKRRKEEIKKERKMGVIAKGIPRGCQGLFTPMSLGYPLSVFNKNSTLKERK